MGLKDKHGSAIGASWKTDMESRRPHWTSCCDDASMESKEANSVLHATATTVL